MRLNSQTHIVAERVQVVDHLVLSLADRLHCHYAKVTQAFTIRFISLNPPQDAVEVGRTATTDFIQISFLVTKQTAVSLQASFSSTMSWFHTIC
jgi:hypothetical protein